MPRTGRRVWLAITALVVAAGVVGAQEPAPLPVAPAGVADTRPLPITLPTALQLAGVNPLDIAVATERLRIASAQYDRARVLWLPNLSAGVDYFRHDGQIQDIVGTVFTTSRSSVLVGGGPGLSVAAADALYAPLAARQVIRARQADVQAARNDSTLAVAEAYFAVQQARGEVAGSADSVRRAEELVRRAEQLAPGLVPTVEVSRARAELARRKQAVEAAYERWQVSSADLTRLLRLDPAAVVEPAEDPALRVELVNLACPVDDLIPVALTNRPELASQQALVQATLARLRQEKVRPLVPSVALRGVGSNTPGLSSGYFGGGVNDSVGNFGGRNSMDLQLVWQLDNLGFGNRAAVREREAENRLALVELLRVQDRVAAEVAQALARAKRAANRVKEAEGGVRSAAETAEKNLQGLGQTKRVGEQLVLVFRPQEAVAAVTALDQAYRDYYAAVADANRVHFALYRALGQPAQALLAPQPAPAPPAAPAPARTASPQPAPSPAGIPVHQPGTLPAWVRSSNTPAPKRP
ncbi:MAG TPA: TolC family protein [Fimbriiglobus sp.]|nr:TolC family protein [Fimbriiglobus sp.]